MNLMDDPVVPVSLDLTLSRMPIPLSRNSPAINTGAVLSA